MNIKKFSDLVEDPRLWWSLLGMAIVSGAVHLIRGSWFVAIDVVDVGLAVLILRYEYGKRRRARAELHARLSASFRAACEAYDPEAKATYSGYYRPQRPIVYRRPGNGRNN